MDIFFDLIILAVFGYWGWRLARAILRRILFMRRLCKICDRRHYRLRRVRNPVMSFFGAGALPDLVVGTQDKEYCVRFVTSIDRGKFYYFANEQYAASYQRGAIALPFARRADTVTYRQRFHYFPPKAIPEYLEGKTGVTWILLFNPAPAEITSFNEAQTKQYVLGNGELIGALAAYDGRTFCQLLEGE